MKIRIVHHVEETWVLNTNLTGEEIDSITTEEHSYRPVIVGDNGERIWWAEHYTAKNDAVKAVRLIAEGMGVGCVYHGDHYLFSGFGGPNRVEIEWVEERNED